MHEEVYERTMQRDGARVESCLVRSVTISWPKPVNQEPNSLSCIQNLILRASKVKSQVHGGGWEKEPLPYMDGWD